MTFPANKPTPTGKNTGKSNYIATEWSIRLALLGTLFVSAIRGERGKTFMKYLFTLLTLLPALAFGQTVQKPSLFGSTNTMIAGDAFVISTASGTVSEHIKIIDRTNVYNQFNAAMKMVNGLAIGGDSLSTEINSPTATGNAVGQGAEWPTFVFTNASWRFHLPKFNQAIGGSTAQQWNTTYYNSLIHAQALTYIPWSYIYSHEVGVNDLGARTLAQLTNDLAAVWALARADYMYVAAWTIPWDTNLIGNATALTLWTNVNTAIPTMTGLYDYLVTMPTITNASLQLLDNVHPTPTQNVALATAFANATRGSSSGTYTNVGTAEQQFSAVQVDRLANIFSARITGLLLNGYGAGMDLYYDHTTGNSGGGIRSYDITHSAYRDLTMQANAFHVYDQGHAGIFLHGNTTLSNATFYAITNQITFGKTNPPPASAVAPTKWIDVRVSGDATLYRLPLYQ